MLLMRQSYRMIPVYTADVSGVCSALYELGGMTVMHDPSGCNSTYNTHDEIRWYDMDSLIFISGLTESDAIFGNDEKFVQDIETAAMELHPQFIALAGSQIPFMNGTDFPALAKLVEEDTGIPAFSVPTNGMHNYVYGAGIALAEIAKRFTDEKARCTDKRSINLLGVTPLDFGPVEHVEKMKAGMERLGWRVISTWAMGDELEDLARAGEAAVNLVVSSVGLRAAEVLKEKFHTPYVVGTPVKGFAERLSEKLEEAVQETAKDAGGKCFGDKVAYFQGRLPGEAEITLIGEPVMMGSLAAAIEKETGRAARVLCPLQESEGLLASGDRKVRGEEEAEKELAGAKIIVADPLYGPICPAGSELYELPHIAFSGRIYQKKIPDLFKFTKN